MGTFSKISPPLQAASIAPGRADVIEYLRVSSRFFISQRLGGAGGGAGLAALRVIRSGRAPAVREAAGQRRVPAEGCGSWG